MKLTAQQVFDVTQVLSRVIQENRPMPLKGAYRMARLHAKLLPEFTPIEERRNAIILDLAKGGESALPTVPDEKMDDFRAQWGQIAEETVEVDVEPIPLDLLDMRMAAGPLTAQELLTLGELVTE